MFTSTNVISVTARRCVARLGRYYEHLKSRQTFLTMSALFEYTHGLSPSPNVPLAVRLRYVLSDAKTIWFYLRGADIDKAAKAAFESADLLAQHSAAEPPGLDEIRDLVGEYRSSTEHGPVRLKIDESMHGEVSGWIEKLYDGPSSGNDRIVAEGQISCERLLVEGVFVDYDGVCAERLSASPIVGATWVVRGEPNSTATTVRYRFSGISIPGLSEHTYVSALNEFGERRYSRVRDSVAVNAFGFRGRLRQVCAQKGKEDLTVVFEAPGRLSSDQEHALFLTLSFLAGGRAHQVSVDARDALGHQLWVGYGDRASSSTSYRQPFGRGAFPAQAFQMISAGFLSEASRKLRMPIALHHLLDANTGYAEADLRDSALAIHALFEAWADEENQREIVAEDEWRRFEPEVKQAIKASLPSNDATIKELRAQLYGTLRRAHLRTGATLQQRFLSTLRLPVDEDAARGLSRRNKLVHEGTAHASLQLIQCEDPAVRSLANAVFLRLLGYQGPVYDWLSGEMRAYI